MLSANSHGSILSARSCLIPRLDVTSLCGTTFVSGTPARYGFIRIQEQDPRTSGILTQNFTLRCSQIIMKYIIFQNEMDNPHEAFATKLCGDICEFKR